VQKILDKHADEFPPPALPQPEPGVVDQLITAGEIEDLLGWEYFQELEKKTDKYSGDPDGYWVVFDNKAEQWRRATSTVLALLPREEHANAKCTWVQVCDGDPRLKEYEELVATMEALAVEGYKEALEVNEKAILALAQALADMVKPGLSITESSVVKNYQPVSQEAMERAAQDREKLTAEQRRIDQERQKQLRETIEAKRAAGSWHKGWRTRRKKQRDQG
jgi:hypothetical protein